MQRLKTRVQFQAVLAGDTVARTAHFALHWTALDVAFVKSAPSGSPTSTANALFAVRDVWMGALVPKRWAKRAVTRNAIKRQIYSISADFELVLPSAAHVVRLRAGFDRTRYISATSDVLMALVRQELQQLFTNSVARLNASTLHRGAM